MEHLTADIEDQAKELMQRVEDLGGSVHAIEAGFLQREIEEAAWAFHTRIKTKQDVLVGVNEYVEDEGQLDVEILRIDPQHRAGSRSSR